MFMKHPTSLTDVAERGLCVGCGLCAGLSQNGEVEMVMTAEGFLRPRPTAAMTPAWERRILALCPGNTQQGAMSAAGHLDTLWGPFERLMTGHASDAELRFKASSGGVISAISLYLLESGKVDRVLNVAATRTAALRSTWQLSVERGDIIAAAGARYGPAAPLAEIGNILARGERLAVVGKPCDIAGISNLMRSDERAAALIRYRISFLCAGLSSLAISRQIVGKYGLQERDVRVMRYRGHGCPGLTHIEAHDGRVFQQTYDETWSEELNQDIQFRCKICPDSTGEQADIVCGDAWIAPDGYAHGEFDGWNSIIARTSAGDALLTDMEREGRLRLGKLSIDGLNAMQPHQGERKMAVLARLLGLVVTGQLVPRFRRLRLLTAMWAGRRMALGNLLGTMRRVRRGANIENCAPEPPFQ